MKIFLILIFLSTAYVQIAENRQLIPRRNNNPIHYKYVKKSALKDLKQGPFLKVKNRHTNAENYDYDVGEGTPIVSGKVIGLTMPRDMKTLIGDDSLRRNAGTFYGIMKLLTKVAKIFKLIGPLLLVMTGALVIYFVYSQL